MELLAITNDRFPVKELALSIIEMQDSIDYIHIREKSKSVQELYLLLQFLRRGKVRDEKIVVHDRLDLALLNGIPNVHLPGHGLPVYQVKTRFPELRIGRSVHSFQEAKSAEQEGADYVLFGHVFDTKCKAGLPGRGLDEFSKIRKALDIPAYAIGGITLCKLDLVRRANAAGAAVLSGIFDSEDPVESALEYSIKAKAHVDISISQAK
ncbi:thiamine phosphate synthase [Mesobacillus foraminis]|uniref:thiamine phosphate synthase n=1 Tax=Mesobacillus foraminis TaxID=279826 RepID=UPI0039A2D46A